jgi:hypothetical protein
MIGFFKRLGLFSLLCLLLSGIVISIYVLVYKVSFDDIPAPPLSDSYSLNEKIEFLRTAKKEVPVLAIGSSISLNNLSSETLVKHFRSNAFLNTASWGMNMQDNYNMLKTLYEVYHPDTLILASSIVEFEKSDKQVNYSLLKEYLTAGDFKANLYHLKCFNLRYYMDNINYKKMVRADKHRYEYLVFDANGGINLEGEGFKIDQRRWNASFEKKDLDTLSYLYLDSISTFCKNKNIEFLFFQSPFRKGIYMQLDASKTAALNTHLKKIETILKKNDQVFIDTDDVLWNDSLFIDFMHFNKNGAGTFTKYCLDKL